MHRALLLLVLLLWVRPTARLEAQGFDDLAPGHDVRIWVPSQALLAERAVVDSVASSAIVLLLPRLDFPLTVPVSSITRLEVRTSRGSALTGAFVGGAVGLAVGLGISQFAVKRLTCSSDGPCELAYFGFPPGGLIVGAVVGGFMSGSPWKRVPLPK